MSSSNDVEIRGRLLLWAQAISECLGVCSILKRNKAELDSGRPLQKEDTFSKSFNEYARQRPDYEPGKAKSSHFLEFSKTHPKEYPSFVDCSLIEQYCQMMAVVLYCQILNPGNCDAGNVSSNTKNFVDTHLSNIKYNIFKSKSDIDKFDDFNSSCLKARNKMIGHADGESFQMTHGHEVTVSKMHAYSIQGIDFQYMDSILAPLQRAVFEYIRVNFPL